MSELAYRRRPRPRRVGTGHRHAARRLCGRESGGRPLLHAIDAGRQPLPRGQRARRLNAAPETRRAGQPAARAGDRRGAAWRPPDRRRGRPDGRPGVKLAGYDARLRRSRRRRAGAQPGRAARPWLAGGAVRPRRRARCAYPEAWSSTSAPPPRRSRRTSRPPPRCKAAGAGGVLVSLGGDIAVAGEPPPGGWSIQVSEDSGAPIAPMARRPSPSRLGGIATSSTTVRRWTRGGVVLHHIIDPATGLPADRAVADGDASSRAPAWTPTSPPPPRSCMGAEARRPGSKATGCRPPGRSRRRRPPRRRAGPSPIEADLPRVSRANHPGISISD